MKIPEGHITLADLAQDIAERTQPAGRHNGQKRPPKAEEGFPLDTLPAKLEELIRGAETALGMPPDFLAASCLLATAAAAGNAVQLQVKRATLQRPTIYLVLVGWPNSNKSGPLEFAFRPLLDRDGETYAEYRDAKAKHDVWARLPKKKQAEEDEPKFPIFTRSIISDATPEALVSAHMDNLKGLTLLRDELAGWWKSFDRYNKGGEEQFWLSNWSGKPIIVDRKTSGPARIAVPFISVGGTIQPDVLEQLAADGRAGNGFIDRLLFVWPDGLEKPLWTEDDINAPLVEAYHTAISRLLGLKYGTENPPLILTLEPDAKARLFRFFNQENKPRCDAAENKLLAGMHGKFDFHAGRLVIVLHLLHWAYWGEGTPPTNVTLATVERAISAAEYFRSQALKAFERMHNSSPLDKLPGDKQRLYDALPETFRTSDGVAIATKAGIPERTFKRMLSDKQLFQPVSRGEYQKLL